MSKKLTVFDVDGVLLDNQLGSFKEVLVILGKEQEVRRLDEEYQRRKSKGPWGLERLASLYKGFSENELRKTAFRYCQETLRKGTREIISELKNKGYIVGALSSNPQFIMDVLFQILNLDFSEGTRIEFDKNGIATGEIAKKVDRYVKAEILQEFIIKKELKRKNIIVVGDSITDLPMAELAGVFVALCPKDETVKEKADLVIKNFAELKKKLL